MTVSILIKNYNNTKKKKNCQIVQTVDRMK